MADYRSTGKELRKSPKGLIAWLCVGVLAIGGAFGVKRILSNMQPIVPDSEQSAESSEVDIPILNDPSDESSENTREIFYSYDAVFRDAMAKGSLILVNREHSIEDMSDGLVSVFEHRGDYFSVKDTDVLLTEECISAFTEMTNDFFRETGHKDLQIISGYRTKAYQKKLYDKDASNTDAPEADRVAAPGCSDHETGCAFDVNIYNKGVAADFDGTGDYDWLIRHCEDYGFIIRYPQDKVDITKFSYEPWHFRYVGKLHAAYMAEHNLCLEEYLEEIKQYPYEGEHLRTANKEGNLCEVFYLPAPEDTASVIEIPIPIEQKYTVSGNNMDGFIITVESDFAAPESITETTAPAEKSTPSDTTVSSTETTVAANE